MNESLEVVCPEWGSDIPLDDVKVANDIALCRKCSRNFSFAEAISEAEPVHLAHPPKGVYRKKFRWDEVKDIRVETKRSSKGSEYQQIVIEADTSISLVFRI